MLEIKNTQALGGQMDRWIAKITKKAERAARGYAVTFFDRMLYASPQYSGDFVAGFNVSLNSVDTSFEGYPGLEPDGATFQQGSKAPIQVAKFRNASAFGRFKLGDTIYISNSAVHDQPYALKIYNKTINFRPVNAAADLQLALGTFKLEFRGELSPPTVKYLENVRAVT